MENFGLDIWGDDNFIIKDGTINLNYASSPSLLEITKNIRKKNHSGPLLLRFPHLIKKQIDTLFNSFDSAIEEFGYRGKFNAIFPLKVNQFPNFVDSLIDVSKSYNYGLEAGSKAELIIAMTKTPLGSPITINGFKDKEMISLCFIASQMGHNITITIEGLNELETIIEVDKEFNQKEKPNIGIRIRLHSFGVGIWAKSGGYNAKFGMNSTEILKAYDMLDEANLLNYFTMLHFHIGSQMGDISPLKKALREVGNIYASLKNRGAFGLESINIGGGLAVEYSQYREGQNRNYSINEFANDVIYLMKDISKSKGVDEPNIFTESGRFISASHLVLVAPVLELFSQEYNQEALRLKKINPPLVEELNDLWININKDNAKEYLHDALDHLESLLTLFDLGYIDLEDRSNTEILVNLIIKKAIYLLKNEHRDELSKLQDGIEERYLVNFSTFSSLPDFWGLAQEFPIVPLDRLDIKPTNRATIWDITCDSDGEIGFNRDLPLYLHDIDVHNEEYFLGFFLTGAYQEVLGMKHNLFTHPTEAVIEFDKNGQYYVKSITKAQNLLEILSDLNYDKEEIKDTLKTIIEQSDKIEDKNYILDKLYLYLSENSYLKTNQYKLGKI